MTSDIKRSDYKILQTRLDKLKFKKQQMEKKNPNLKKDQKEDVVLKLEAMNSLIGYLVRKGLNSEFPMDILIDIANDYEKKLNDK